MKIKRVLCMVFVFIFAMSSFTISAGAVSAEPHSLEIAERASGKFSMDISANKHSAADMSFFMNVEESITITATYAPQSASVDFGLIGPDGRFYHQNTKSGSISVAFDIKERGEYTLAVRNNSSYEISVSGYVNY